MHNRKAKKQCSILMCEFFVNIGVMGMFRGSTISGDLVGGGKRLQIFKASRGGIRKKIDGQNKGSTIELETIT